jgi:DNA-nicking Smr family endonuclease
VVFAAAERPAYDSACAGPGRRCSVGASERPSSGSDPGGIRRPSGRLDISKLTLDLHDIFNRGDDIDRALRAVLAEATRIKASSVEIIPGKGSGQLKKRVLRFLEQPEIKPLYHRIEKDSKNYGRLFVHFRWK